MQNVKTTTGYNIITGELIKQKQRILSKFDWPVDLAFIAIALELSQLLISLALLQPL